MLNDKFLIKSFLNIFKLDERASKKELELSYEVLSKNATPEQVNNLRRAYEYLMYNFYGVENELTVNQIAKTVPNEELEVQEAIGVLPDMVNEGIKELEQDTNLTLSEKVKLNLSTQNVNVPLLYRNIKLHCRKFLGFRFWNKKDLDNIVSISCLNPLKFVFFTFTLSSGFYNEIKSIKEFVKGCKKMYGEEKGLCKDFTPIFTTEGSMGRVIIEENTLENMLILMESKANLEGWDFCYSID